MTTIRRGFYGGGGSGGSGPETDPLSLHVEESYRTFDQREVIRLGVTGEAEDRIVIRSSGSIEMGDGIENPKPTVLSREYLLTQRSFQFLANEALEFFGGDILQFDSALGVYVAPNSTLSFFGQTPGAQPAAIAAIADPTQATAEDVANKVNAIAAALRTLGLIAT